MYCITRTGSIAGLLRLAAVFLTSLLTWETAFAWRPFPWLCPSHWGTLAVVPTTESDDEYDRSIEKVLANMLRELSRAMPTRCNNPDSPQAPEGTCYPNETFSTSADEEERITLEKAWQWLCTPLEISWLFSEEELAVHYAEAGRFYVIRHYAGVIRENYNPWHPHSALDSPAVVDESGTAFMSIHHHCDVKWGFPQEAVQTLLTSVFKHHARNLRYPTMRLPGAGGSLGVFARPSKRFPQGQDVYYCVWHLDVEP